MDTGLGGKVVIVTGATANIGRGVALAFAAEGARVVVAGRDADAGKRVLEAATELGAADVLWQAADVTVEADVHALVGAVVERFGGVDVLVNNVGGSTEIAPFQESRPAQWQADIDLTLTSTLLCTHAVLPHMLARGGGRIVNIGSMAGIIGDRFMAVYSAAKGAVHAFTRVLALELGTAGITVNAIAPYGTRSEDPDEQYSTGSRYHPENGMIMAALRERPDLMGQMRRPAALERQSARPAEIGAAAVYLASDGAGFVTGQVLQVEGGVTLV